MAKQTKPQIQQAVISIKGKLDVERGKNSPDPKEITRLTNQLKVLAAQYQRISPAKPSKDDKREELTNLAETDPEGLAMSFIQGVNTGAIDSTIDLIPNVGNVLVGSLNYLLEGTGNSFRIPEAAKVSDVVDIVSGKTTGFKPFETQRSQMEGVGDTAAERVAGTVGQFMGGSAAIAPALAKTIPYASQTVQRIAGKESVLGAGAGVAAGTTAEYTDNPYLQLGAALAGGTLTELGGAGLRLRKDIFTAGKETAKAAFTKEGREKAVERRVATYLSDNIVDPEVTVNNIKSNRLLVEEVLPEGEVTSLGLAENAAVDRALSMAAQDSPRLAQKIATGTERNNAQLIGVLEKSAPAGDVTPEVLVGAEAVSRAAEAEVQSNAMLGLRSNMEAEADLARESLKKLKTNPDPEFRIEQQSNALVNATKKAFQRAKEVQRKVWETVERTEPLELKPLRAELLNLHQSMKKGMTTGGDIPNVLELIKKLGNADNNNFNALEDFRSNLLSKQRQAYLAGDETLGRNFEKMLSNVDDYIDTAGTSPQYREAAAYTRSFRQAYYQGDLGRILKNDGTGAARIEPDAALETVLSPKGAGSAQVSRFVQAEEGAPVSYSVGDDGKLIEGTPLPAAEGLTAPIQVALRDMFFDVKDKAKFLKDYSPTFRLFPKLADDLDAINSEINVAAEKVASLEGRTATSIDVEKVKAASLLGDDPDRIVPKLKALSAKEAKNLVEVMKRQGVNNGLQAIVMREFMRMMRLTGTEGYKAGKTSLDGLIAGANDPGMKILFDNVLSKQQQQSLRKVDRVASLVLDNTKKVDSSTSASLKSSPMGSKVVSAWIGSTAAGLTGARSNLILTSRIMGTVDKVLSGLSQAQTQAILEKALMDSDYLIDLIRLPKAADLPSYEATLRGYLYVAGIDATEEEKEQKRKASSL